MNNGYCAMEKQETIKVFEEKRIRTMWDDEQEKWYFSVVDVVEILTESPNPRQYWRKMKDRDLKQYELYPIWVQLRLQKQE